MSFFPSSSIRQTKFVSTMIVFLLAALGAIYWYFELQRGKGQIQGRADNNIARDYSLSKMSFEENRGQTDDAVDFVARGAGYTLFLQPHEATFSLISSRKSEQSTTRGSDNEKRTSAVLKLQLIGAAERAASSRYNQLPSTSNYFIGNDPQGWRTGVPSFAKVQFHEIYQGIDLEYYGNQKNLEYDFRVAPGADPEQILLKFDGADSVKLEPATGDLLIEINGQIVRQQKPFVYQGSALDRVEISSRFELRESGEIGFDIEHYDATQTLIIDPVLIYSTYFGGTGSDVAYDIAVDAQGNAYITGDTTSLDFPMVAPFQGVRAAGFNDIFIAKINAGGAEIGYSTYLGGSDSETGIQIAVDQSGDAYVTGHTGSSDFPLANPLQDSIGGGNDSFVVKLNTTGSTLLYSTYLGGSSRDLANGIAVDSSGNAYVIGSTASSNFPVSNAFQPVRRGEDVFVSKINPSGTGFVFSTFLGGTSTDVGTSIAADVEGNSYLTGFTVSNDFPTVNPIQGVNPGFGNNDAFVTKMNSSGSSIVYSTYLGGDPQAPITYQDYGYGIAVDAWGNAYVVGETQSPTFPTVNAFQPNLVGENGVSDAFVTKINAAGSAFVFSSFLGGTSLETAHDIALDSDNNVYVTGMTRSTNFPTVVPIQGSQGGQFGTTDAFVTKIDRSGSFLRYSTYLGGAENEIAFGIDVAESGNAYVTGRTDSQNFPTANVVRPRSGQTEAFISVIEDIVAPTPTPTPTPTPNIDGGALDLSFGTEGTVVASIPGAFSAVDMALQADGKILLASGVNDPTNIGKFAVIRLNPDGSPDETFGIGGLSKIVFDQIAREVAYTIVVQADGKIVIAGVVEFGSPIWDIGVARLNPDGSLDTTFGSGGKFKVPISGENYPSDIAVQPDGRIVIAGRSRVQPNWDGTLVRLTANGSLDSSFNGTGILIVPISSNASFDVFNKVIVQANGRITVAGETSGGISQDTAVLRYNVNGTPDTTFGSGGRVVVSAADQNDRAAALTIQPDGRLLVGGAGTNGSADFATLVRLNSNGSLDTTFGNAGKITLDTPPNRLSIFKEVMLQADGRILAVGADLDAITRGDFMVARFSSTGVLDGSFGLGGIVRTRFGAGNDSAANCAVLQNDNKLLVAGWAETNGNDGGYAVARYHLTAAPVVEATPTPTPTPTATPSPSPTPTPTTFSISGRTVTDAGVGIRNQIVTAMREDNVSQIATTSSFGFFTFSGLQPGRTYVISVRSKRYRFTPRIIELTYNVDDIILTALE
jgi:uncharacterized delta-60 repeat protein